MEKDETKITIGKYGQKELLDFHGQLNLVYFPYFS